MSQSKFGNIIKQAREETRKPENQKTSGDNLDMTAVNLSIKVPKAYRQHWLIEAKKADTSLTEAITKALNERFGNPM